MRKKLKDRIHDKKVRWQFLNACAKVKKRHNKVNAFRFKILRTCLRDLDKVGLPVTTKEKDLMAKMIQLYDKTLDELSNDVNRFRGYIEMQ